MNIPATPMLKAGNIRTGFYTTAQIKENLKVLPHHSFNPTRKTMHRRQFDSMIRKMIPSMDLLNMDNISIRACGKEYKTYFIEIASKIYQIGAIREKIFKNLSSEELEYLLTYNEKNQTCMIVNHSCSSSSAVTALGYNRFSQYEKTLYEKIKKIVQYEKTIVIKKLTTMQKKIFMKIMIAKTFNKK